MGAARDVFAKSVARYGITRREQQVLELIFAGRTLDEIAHDLFICSSTVQDHIGHMLDKSDSRNRSVLIAKMLGWEGWDGRT